MLRSSSMPNESFESIWKRLQSEAEMALEEEPALSTLLHRTVLAPGVNSFETAIAQTVCYRLLQTPCQTSKNSPPAAAPVFCPNSLNAMLCRVLLDRESPYLELGHTMVEAVKEDALAVLDRDPACETLLEVILFMKGFSALVCHRAAYQKWHQQKAEGKLSKRSLTALFLQSQASAVFRVDIHPAAQIGAGILLDHGTGIVIGETAVVGDGCTLLHGVTLGGTGKDMGDRHPKVGSNVLIGAGTSVLGNIHIGNACKIGAGSIVLKGIPDGATAVGAPAKIVGRAAEANPARTLDENLHQVKFLHASTSSMTLTTMATSDSSEQSLTNDSISEDEFREKASHLSTKNINPADPAAPTGRRSVRKRQHAKTSKKNEEREQVASVCPFREYVNLSRKAPLGSVTFCSLRGILHQEGCSSDEIGSIFFSLDTRNVGYVKWDVFLREIGDALVHYSRLPSDRIQALVKEFRQEDQTPWPTPRSAL